MSSCDAKTNIEHKTVEYLNDNVKENAERDGKKVEEEYGHMVATKMGWVPKLLEQNYRTTQLLFSKRNGKIVTCLKKPKDLYVRKASLKSAVKWPSELCISSERPHHILTSRINPEPLLKKEKEATPPQASSSDFGKVVYDNSPDPDKKYFTTSKSDNKLSSLRPYYTLSDGFDQTLVFESRFESGNLMRAIKTREYDYQLWLNFDLYTKKHTQWFYFRLQNVQPNISYRFTIMNFLKSGSLYNEGMKPLLYSERDAKERNIGWIRAGSNIKYYKNDIKVEGNKGRCYSSLSWTCTFPNKNDTYYLAHSYPYTYSDLQEYLFFLANDQSRRKVCKQKILCQTLAGNNVHVLTISEPTRCPKQAKRKKAIVITARVHPGETVASWMMKGLLDYLTSEEKDAVILRETFLFKIIPMLNPDGVIVGNYRCSLAGRDLNRNYKTLLKDVFPPVWSLRCLIKRLQEEREVVLFCDFHGHSRKKDVFLYGCDDVTKKGELFHSRVFPYMMNKNIPHMFSYSGCRFRVQKNKEGTGRVVMWDLGIRYSYTLEASFCSSSSNDDYHFNVEDYEAIGYHFCDTLLDLFDPDTLKFNNAIKDIAARMRTLMIKKMVEKGELNISDIEADDFVYCSELETDSIGSDSSVSDGLPLLNSSKVSTLNKKKHLKTRKERNKNLKQDSVRRARKKHLSSRDSTIDTDKPRGRIRKKKKMKYSRSAKLLNTPSRSRYSIFDDISETYVQAGLFPSATPAGVSREKELLSSKSPSCQRCNATRLAFEITDTRAKEKNRMPALLHEINPTLELARRITSFNHRTGKVSPKLSQMLTAWASKTNQREGALKKPCLSHDSDIGYSCLTLDKPKMPTASNEVKSQQSDTLRKTSSEVSILHKATSVDLRKMVRPSQTSLTLSPPRVKNVNIFNRKKCLPELRHGRLYSGEKQIESLPTYEHSVKSYDLNLDKNKNKLNGLLYRSSGVLTHSAHSILSNALANVTRCTKQSIVDGGNTKKTHRPKTVSGSRLSSETTGNVDFSPRMLSNKSFITVLADKETLG